MALWASLAVGCAAPPKPQPAAPKPFDPESASGADMHRSGATLIVANQPATDEVSFPRGDRTDWKSVDLTGRPGTLRVKLTWDNAASTLDLEAFDPVGTSLAKAEATDGPTRALSVQVPGPGTNYIRVQAR